MSRALIENANFGQTGGRSLAGLDLLGAAFCGMLTAVYATCLFLAWHGNLPKNDVYFGSDPQRIILNLISTDSDYHRTPFHPLFAALCAIFVHLRGNHDFAESLSLGCALYGFSVSAGTYLATRLWGLSRRAALIACGLVASSGGFAVFAALPEAHVWGGLSVLICLIGSRLLPNGIMGRTFTSACLLAISASMVITDMIVWAFSQVRFTHKDRSIAELIGNNILFLIISIVLGVAILEIMFLLEVYLFYPNNTLGRLFEFAHDKKYILAGGDHNSFGGLLALTPVVPFGPWARRIALIAAAATVIVCLVGPRQTPALDFLRISLLPILALHSVYDRAEAFICAPDYIPLVAILLASTMEAAMRSTQKFLMAVMIIAGLGALNNILAAQARQSLQPSEQVPIDNAVLGRRLESLRLASTFDKQAGPANPPSSFARPTTSWPASYRPLTPLPTLALCGCAQSKRLT